MTGVWVHRDSETSWVDGRAEMIAGLLPMSALECGDSVAELSDRRSVIGLTTRIASWRPAAANLCESASDRLG